MISIGQKLWILDDSGTWPVIVWPVPGPVRRISGVYSV